MSDAFAELYVRWEELPSHGEAGLLRWLRKTVKLKTYTFHRKQAAEPEKIELTDWLDMGETGWEGDLPEMAEQTDPMDDEFRLAAYVREIKKRLDPEQKRLFDCVILPKAYRAAGSGDPAKKGKYRAGGAVPSAENAPKKDSAGGSRTRICELFVNSLIYLYSSDRFLHK